MTPQFNIRFSIDRVNDELNLILTDTSDYTGVSTYYGFYKIIYPDSVVVENTDVDNPDFKNGVAITTIPLRLRQGIIQGEFSITQKSYTDIGDYELEKVFTLSFAEPSLIMSDNSNLVTPSVSFLDITQYVNAGYNPSVTRVIDCKFPTTTTVTDTITTTSNEIFMLKDGKSYEGVYKPKLTSTALFTADEHEVQWIQEKSFEFDIRAFIAISQLIIEIDKVKDRLDNSKGNERELMDDYFMVTSLYTQLLANWGDGIYNDIAVTASTVNRLALEAAQSALEALNSAAEALGYKNDASGFATNASNSASTATTQAGIATTKAGEASTDADTATTQAGIATTQAGIATTSAGEAEASALIAIREPANRESAIVLFDEDYISGIDSIAITNNITFDFTDAKRGTTTYMRYSNASAFTFGSEAVLMFDPLNISTTVPNFFCFMLLDKTIGAEIVHVSLEQAGV